jgi:hypothetical protein
LQQRGQFRGVAQLVEQRSPKPRAEGSSPSAPAKKRALFGLPNKALFNEIRSFGTSEIRNKRMKYPSDVKFALQMKERNSFHIESDEIFHNP